MDLMKNDRRPTPEPKTDSSPGLLRRLLEWIAKAGDSKNPSGC